MNVLTFFSKEEQESIIHSIKKVEEKTDIEICVHLESKCKENIYDHAAYVFKKLKMHKTKKRTGILIYLAIDNKKFVVLGDTGVNQKVKKSFWENLCDNINQNFNEAKFTEGIIKTIKRCGEEFQAIFPARSGNINELPNTISSG